MTRSSDRDDATPRRQRDKRSLGGKSKAGGIAVVILLGIYSFAAPQLNARFGWGLPQLRTDSNGNVALAEARQDRAATQENRTAPQQTDKPVPAKSVTKKSAADENRGKSTTDTKASDPSVTKTKQAGSKETRAGPLAGRVGTSRSKTGGNATPEASNVASSDESLEHGLLREISRDRFISPAGLLYTPGSAEGHRLEHLRRHTKDDPGRPGKHGVFDGGMEGALKTIDRAYERAKKGQRTTKELDKGRTIYTVDLGGRVGYVGGRDGGRKRNPMARRVKIVLEGNQFITAYPL